MPGRRTNKVYSDIRGDMLLNPATDDVVLYTNEDAIKYSIFNLLTTNYNERPFQPRIGSNVLGMLFENDSQELEEELRAAIIETIDNFEPRCLLTDVIVIPDPDNNTYQVEINYRVLNNEEPQSFALVLDRVR